MVITVTLNPAVDKTVIIPRFRVDAVNRVEQIITDPGGKGINVSKSVQAMGGETLCLGIVGGDTGTYICNALEKMSLRHDMVYAREATRVNTKIVDPVLGTNTDINEPGASVTAELLEKVWGKVIDAAKPGDVVVFAGKNPPGTPEALLAEWTKSLRERDVAVCLDTVGQPMELALKEKPAIIKPNLEELCAIMGKALPTDDAVVQAARELIGIGVGLVAVSMGADGALFVAKDQTVRTHCPCVTPVSTVGAGDAMMAALAHCYGQERSLEEIARTATAVATATVQVSGSSPAGQELIGEMLSQITVD